MYLQHLATGHTLVNRAIKVDTMRRYLSVAANLICPTFCPHDPRYEINTTTEVTGLAAIYKNCKRWEQIPNKQEPLTTVMQQHLEQKAANFPSTSKTKAIAEWTRIGLYQGNRNAEWAQTTSKHRKIGYHQLNQFKRAYAFTLGRFQFFTIRNEPIELQDALQDRDRVAVIRVQYDQQKNCHNGEWKKGSRNKNSRSSCFVENYLNILQRFVDLVGFRYDLPLSIYKDEKTDEIYNIIADDINAALQEAAIAVYNLDPIRDAALIKKWTTHSIRIGACNILHAMQILIAK